MDLRARKYAHYAAPLALTLLTSTLFTPKALAIAIGSTTYPTFADALAAYQPNDVIEIEQSDSGEISTTADAVSGKKIDFEAGSTATLKIDVQYPTLSEAVQSLPLYNISQITVVGQADPEVVWERIAVTGTIADKFKLFWSNQDAQYYTNWPNQTQSQIINKVGVQIGNIYAAHLNAGNAPILDIVQTKISGNPNFAGRRQSLHDNILGNLENGVIAGRFPSPAVDPRTAAALDYGTRPVHDGTVNAGLYTKAQAKTSLAWDLAWARGTGPDSLDYFDALPAMFGNTITVDSKLTSPPATAVLYTDLATAVNAASASDRIRISAGNFTQSATVNLDENSLTLIGAGQGETVITSQTSSYGMMWTGNDITLQDLSYNGPTADAGSSYGFKIQPPSAASQPVTGVTIRNVTVSGSGRAEIDLHYVDGALIENVTASGNNTKGAGVALTTS
ncbi:MAG TPA: hypothetical protein VGE69_10830, partial [Pseudomonadales bacterium]